MRTATIAAVSALLCAAPASARLHAVFSGTINQQLKPGQDPYAAIGDTITIAFDVPSDWLYDPDGSGWLATGPSDDPDFFRIRTSRGLQWLARDEMLDSGLRITEDGNSFYGFFVPTLSDQPTISISYYKGVGLFTIKGVEDYGGVLYGNVSTSPGFVGSFARAGGIPEPTAWAMMIAGFAVAGAALRRKSAKLAAQPKYRAQPSALPAT